MVWQTGSRSNDENLHAGRFDGLVNLVLIGTDLVRIKRSGLVNRFNIRAYRTGPYSSSPLIGM